MIASPRLTIPRETSGNRTYAAMKGMVDPFTARIFVMFSRNRFGTKDMIKAAGNKKA